MLRDDQPRRDGPPPWLHPPAVAESPSHQVDDARVHAEIWSGGIRLFAEGYAEDDAAWDHEPWSTYFSLEEAVCLCNTLACGKDTHFEEEAWGRMYRRVFSLDSHTSEVQADPARQQIWFYPMTERRLVFRMVVGPLIPALSELFYWTQHELSKVDPEVQGAQSRLLRRGLSLLDEAARRIVRT